MTTFIFVKDVSFFHIMLSLGVEFVLIPSGNARLMRQNEEKMSFDERISSRCLIFEFF